jgi:DNA ligase D-like protein (predicted ligase)
VPDASPSWTEPMLARPEPASGHRGGDEWVYERKLDGLRCVAVRAGDTVELWSRNRRSYTARFPAVVSALSAVPADRFVADGELAVIDGEQTSFSLLQQGGGGPARLCLFDLMHLLGTDTRPLPLVDRKQLLAQAMDGAGPELPLVGHVNGDAPELLAAACASGWEGLVAKRAASAYRGGRSPDWVKLKCSAAQELVVGGWTEPSGARAGFGALLVGHFDDGGRLHYAGRVGTGFNDATLADVFRRLRPLERPTPAFVDAERGRGLHWVEPVLVAEVAFTEWTRDGRLRHPSFKGLRPDKAASAVRREPPVLRRAGR